MTVWYDFTTTMRNSGRSGIANVEWSIGQAMLADDPEVRCFELQGRRGLVEVDPGTRLAHAVYASPLNQGRMVVNAIPNWRDRVRAGLSARLGQRAVPIIRAMSRLNQFANEAQRLRSREGRPAPRSDETRLLDAVGPGDVVVSMGADWEGELAGRLAELKRRTGCRVATMVYDLVPLTHTYLAFHNDPNLFVRYYRALIEVSDLIMCISAQSLVDLIEFAGEQGLTPPRTEVLVLGETEPARRGEVPPPRADFYLCVGTIERRKNLELVYDALRILDSEGRELPRVVVAGAPGWGTRDLIDELQHRSTPASRAMVLLGSVDDEVLDRLYSSAKALLFPSHFEGWGLPVREAAIRGCPVAAGDSPAVRAAAAGYPGATLLSTDDAGPWADYMLGDPEIVAPISRRPWSAVVSDLMTMLRVSE